MGRSFGKPAASNAIEDYTKNNRFYHAASGTWFEMFARDGEYFQRRYQIGYAGTRTNVDETRIDYYLGSGNHARSYLAPHQRRQAGAVTCNLVCRKRRRLGDVAWI